MPKAAPIPTTTARPPATTNSFRNAFLNERGRDVFCKNCPSPSRALPTLKKLFPGRDGWSPPLAARQQDVTSGLLLQDKREGEGTFFVKTVPPPSRALPPTLKKLFSGRDAGPRRCPTAGNNAAHRQKSHASATAGASLLNSRVAPCLNAQKKRTSTDILFFCIWTAHDGDKGRIPDPVRTPLAFSVTGTQPVHALLRSC